MLVMFIIAYHNFPPNSKYRKHVNHIWYTCYKLMDGHIFLRPPLTSRVIERQFLQLFPFSSCFHSAFHQQLLAEKTWEDGPKQAAEIWLNKTRWVELLMFRSFRKLYFGLVIIVINVALGKELEKPGPKMFGSEGSCWSVGFTFETCCAPEFGSEGNTECWDDVYTFESCCQSDGDPKKVGCNSSYFQRFRSLALDYYNLGWSKPALIELWPRILANYNARFLLCPPAALQAQLLQIEERGFLERPEKVIDKLLVFSQCFWVSFWLYYFWSSQRNRNTFFSELQISFWFPPKWL